MNRNNSLFKEFMIGANSNHSPNSIKEFYQMDSEELFKENLKKQPIDWHYRNKKIFYKLNELKYRTVSFSEVKWEESVVLFGCSMGFGLGLAEDETIAYYCQELLNRPVINLSVVSSSTLFALQNSLILFNNFPKPWGVIQLWSSPERINYYVSDESSFYPRHYGPWCTNVPYYQYYIENSKNPEIQSYFNVSLSEALWKNTTRYCAVSYWNYPELNVTRLMRVDNARDLAHPGYKSARLASDVITKILTNNRP